MGKDILKIWIPLILNGIMLLLAGVAVYISIDSYNQANEQFRSNSESTQIMFDSLMERSKKLNENTVSQLIALQKITNNQLKITEEQLKAHKEQINIEVYL